MRFGKWDEVLAVAQPINRNDFLVDQALWHFARGLALAAKLDIAAAAREEIALNAIVISEEIKKLNSPIFPVSDPWRSPRIGSRARSPERRATPRS